MSSARIVVNASLIVISTCWVAACGRVGFDPVSDESPIGPDAPPGERDAGEISTARWVFVAIQGNAASHVQRLEYDPNVSISNRLTKATASVRIDPISGDRIRGLSALDSTTLLAGSGANNPILVSIDADSLSPGSTYDMGSSLRNTHGHCVLPNGNLIVGEYNTSIGNAVVEYRRTESSVSVERMVYSTIHNGGTLSHCVALSSSELLITDQNATNDRDGDIVRLVLSSGAWSETHRLDLSDVGVDTSVYAFAISGSFLYAFPIRRNNDQIKSILRCPTADIRSVNCVELATLPPDETPGDNGPDALQGAHLVPGTSDILFVSNTTLYVYDIPENTWQAAYDMASNFDDLIRQDGQPDQLDVVRGLVVY